jgi:hypothetical protein
MKVKDSLRPLKQSPLEKKAADVLARSQVKAKGKEAAKFVKDELTTGRGKAARLELLKKTQAGGLTLPAVKELAERVHDLKVARGLRGAIQEQLSTVRLGEPLAKADAPRQGKDGRWYAPNGNPLIEVKLETGRPFSRSALVDPLTNTYYVQSTTVGIRTTHAAHGPLSLPKGSQFKDQEFTRGELEQLEKAANAPKRSFPGLPKLPAPPDFPQLPGRPLDPGVIKALEKQLRGLDYGGKAPKPSDVVRETPLRSEHPFSYSAIELKNGDIVIKRVLTGGFVPAKPGDGDYSAPIPR